jgi:CheY-like chemotaxis protein
VLDRTGDLPARAAQPVVVIQRQAEHLAHLLDDLLDVARITSGRIELDHARFDLRRAIELAAEAQQHRIDSKRQRLAMSLPGEAVTVFGDIVRIQQVVGNLLNNASKYTPAGGSIRLTLAMEAGDAVLSVADSGVGIPPDRLDAVFELFVQANPTLARSEGGLGIGLTLVKRVVELHGGRVVARSEGLGRGTDVMVRLPLAAPAGAPSAKPTAPVGAPSRRILVIEDNDDGREMLVTMLRVTGHQVVEAATGREGLAIAAGSLPEVVLLDIGLPDINGYDLGLQLRQALGANAVIVAITGYGQPQDRARSEATGFDAHLVKPVDITKLAEILQKGA